MSFMEITKIMKPETKKKRKRKNLYPEGSLSKSSRERLLRR
jgi:hypothetical protein